MKAVSTMCVIISKERCFLSEVLPLCSLSYIQLSAPLKKVFALNNLETRKEDTENITKLFQVANGFHQIKTSKKAHDKHLNISATEDYEKLVCKKVVL